MDASEILTPDPDYSLMSETLSDNGRLQISIQTEEARVLTSIALRRCGLEVVKSLLDIVVDCGLCGPTRLADRSPGSHLAI